MIPPERSGAWRRSCDAFVRSFSATQDSDRSGVSLAEVDATLALARSVARCLEKTSLSSARFLLYPKRRKEGGGEGSAIFCRLSRARFVGNG